MKLKTRGVLYRWSFDTVDEDLRSTPIPRIFKAPHSQKFHTFFLVLCLVITHYKALLIVVICINEAKEI